MKTSPVTIDDLRRSVISVPPLARNADLSLNPEANRALLRHLRAGEVTTFLYGGNANFYNVGMYEYAGLLDALLEWSEEGDFIIPSAGPNYGALIDQAPILRERPFPTAMVLPASAASTPEGVMTGLRAFAERLGKPIVLYIKSEPYLRPKDAAKLVKEGIVSFIKYAIVRTDPAKDTFLDALLAEVDRDIVVSGMGEQPVPVHAAKFGLRAFTSGLVSIAPAASTVLLRAVASGDAEGQSAVTALFKEMEDIRDARGPARVLHDAVTLSGIADMGPILPLMAGLDPVETSQIGGAVARLVTRLEGLDARPNNAALLRKS